ncbi:hypothetical protein TIFTF001_018649 [Ficus carica]|uniref:Uncharacterized protein n=1 Tax=Ficus carica TaxID=3494 RepID=A0AA88AA64_FICCA|nr:hypothetical protein TIFTF001_018649 [Ficus carica]
MAGRPGIVAWLPRIEGVPGNGIAKRGGNVTLGRDGNMGRIKGGFIKRMRVIWQRQEASLGWWCGWYGGQLLQQNSWHCKISWGCL